MRPKDLFADWEPAADARLTAWEAVHHLIRVLETPGEPGAADLARRSAASLKSRASCA